MRKWILRIHMYVGLLLFGFLLVFALSALCFNHNPAFMESGRSELRWKQPITASPQHDSKAYATAVQEEVGLAGRMLNPIISKKGELRFDVFRPGRRYTVHVAGNVADVYEFRQGWIATVVELHGVRPSTSSLPLKAWAWYSSVGALALALSAVTGVYLWAIRRRERILGWSLLGGATLVSLAICIYMRTWG